MGDWGRHGKKRTYTVQAGDSWEKIAGMLYGNQRAFGDLARLNGYRTLRPGDVIQIGPPRKDNNYFVSNKDVQVSNATNGANYRGPKMQDYNSYRANYAAARAAGQAGVYGQQNFTGTGANAGVASGTTQNGIVPTGQTNWYSPTVQQNAQNWQTNNPQKPQQGPQPQPVQPLPTSGTVGQSGGASNAMAWAQQQYIQSQNAAEQQAAQAQALGKLPQQAQQPSLTIGQNPNLFFNPFNQSVIPTGLPTSGYTPQPSQQQKQTSSQSSSYPSQQALAQQAAQFAQSAAQNILSNTNVPTFIPASSVSTLYQMAQSDTKLGQQINQFYNLDANGNLVPKFSSSVLPGTQPPANVGLPDTYDYSNVLPSGYSSPANYYSVSGRRNYSRYGHGFRTNDYSMRLGQ